MDEIIFFIKNHIYFSLGMVVLNLFLVRALIIKVAVYTNKGLIEAMGGRNEKDSLYRKCTELVKGRIDLYERREKKANFYLNAKDKMKKSGYRSDYAAAIYLFLKFVAPLTGFILVYIVNFPDVKPSIFLSVLIFSAVEYQVNKQKRRLRLTFEKNIYKVYKYLNNQISSGVSPEVAIKTVYLVVEDEDLRDPLMQLASRYELTKDIEKSLAEFKSYFEVKEAQTLCVALRQGIETGDNKEILAKQEEIMFEKYFNYIQAETDSMYFRSLISVFLYAAIIVIMIVIPMAGDIVRAVETMFVN